MQNQFGVLGSFFSISFLVFMGFLFSKQDVSSANSKTSNQTQFTETTINDNSNTSNTWAINGPIRVKGNEKLGLTVQSQNLTSNTPIILHEGLNEWIMLSNGAIVLKNNQKLGLTVQNQNIANGSKIILHEGYNLWKVLSNGAIVLKDKPNFGLTVSNQNLNNNAQIILHGGYNTWTGQVTTTATPPGAITYGSKITLLSYHNKYLVSEGNGALNANRAAAASLEQFIILNAANHADRGAVKFGDRINLKTAQNKYVVAESDGKANANRDAAGAWEAFIILNQANQGSRNPINVDSDKICFKTAHNKFLVAESDGNANANRDAASIWETWRINAKAAPVVVPTSSTSRINWMANINDNTSIAALSIPGTHDSGADYGSSDFVTSPYAKCQDWSITKQLEEGIRYLDVRCRRMGTVFTIHHDVFYQQKNFGNVLNDCKVFLQKNPSETILMRIKEEHEAGPNSESFQAIFRRYKAQYPGIWYDGNSVPNMKTARGKIIILDDNNKLGEGIYFPVVNKERNQYPPALQDEYATGDINGKWNLIKNHLDKAKNGDKNTLYYNHVSATSAPLKSPRDMADACNPKVDNYLSLNGKGRYGVIIMDFPTAGLINNIINANGEVKQLSGVNATYRVEIDACHSDLSNTGTGGRITVAFYSGSTRVGGKYVDNPGDNCLGSDQAFSFTTDKPITRVEVSTNSGDAYYIDELRTFKDGVLAAHHGGDNGNGWCLSTDVSDAQGDWKNYISGTGGKCVSVVSFNFFQ